jgi:hypothetical protein
MNMPSIKASELRIGNLVDLGNRIAKVTEINHLACVVVDLEETQDTIEDYERVKGIPLTEEWLLKSGFIRHHTDYANDIIYIKNVPNNTEFEWGVYPNEVGSGIQIQNRKLLKYVHQLQNLYFALTGEELVVKE